MTDRMSSRTKFALALLVLFSATVAGGQDFKVTLLGTASPAPRPDSFGPSTLVEVGPEKFLFDAGRGATIPRVFPIYG